MIRSSVANDAIELSETMREEDRQEIEDTLGLSPLAALSLGLLESINCLTMIGKSGTVTAMAGVVPRPQTPGYGAVWLLCANDIRENVRELVEACRWYLDALLSTGEFDALTNVVATSNTTHRRLIQFMGFDFGSPIEGYGVGKINVTPFQRMR